MPDCMPRIQHIVYYMLENRSFDNVLGWLYDENNPPRNIIASPGQAKLPFQGLRENTYYNQFPGESVRHYISRGTPDFNCPAPDPNEPYPDVNEQLFGSMKNPPEGKTPDMSGFLQNYASKKYSALEAYEDRRWKEFFQAGQDLHPEHALDVLTSYTPDQLSVLNGLAYHYAVSDMWFSSVPTQTNANRAFSLCGTSQGFVTNQGFLGGFIPGRFNTKSIFEVLTENGRETPADWMIYYQDKLFHTTVFTENAFKIPDPDNHVKRIDEFFEAVQNDRLPAFSYLEPAWFLSQPSIDKSVFCNGNSYHPPGDLAPGEYFLKHLYDSLSADQEIWEKTLLIVTFDEHGGNYDHVPPPWGALPPWGNENPPAGITLENDFRFNRFGVRVPALLISPWVEERTLFRSLTNTPYDHTSVLATILNWTGIPREKWGLGERVNAAPTFEGVLSRTSPRKEIPAAELSEQAQENLKKFPEPSTLPVTPMQKKMLAPALLAKSGGKLAVADAEKAAENIISASKSALDLKDRVEKYFEYDMYANHENEDDDDSVDE